MAEFTVDIANFVKKAKIAPESATKKAFFEVSNKIIRRTPVLDGFLRNNWFAGVNSPVVKRNTTPNANGSDSTASVNSAVSKNIGGDFTLYLNNSLPYAHRIEFEGWSSVKAPQGMVRVSIAEFNDDLRRASAELNK